MSGNGSGSSDKVKALEDKIKSVWPKATDSDTKKWAATAVISYISPDNQYSVTNQVYKQAQEAISLNATSSSVDKFIAVINAIPVIPPLSSNDASHSLNRIVTRLNTQKWDPAQVNPYDLSQALALIMICRKNEVTLDEPEILEENVTFVESSVINVTNSTNSTNNSDNNVSPEITTTPSINLDDNTNAIGFAGLLALLSAPLTGYLLHANLTQSVGRSDPFMIGNEDILAVSIVSTLSFVCATILLFQSKRVEDSETKAMLKTMSATALVAMAGISLIYACVLGFTPGLSNTVGTQEKGLFTFAYAAVGLAGLASVRLGIKVFPGNPLQGTR